MLQGKIFVHTDYEVIVNGLYGGRFAWPLETEASGFDCLIKAKLHFKECMFVHCSADARCFQDISNDVGWVFPGTVCHGQRLRIHRTGYSC